MSNPIISEYIYAIKAAGDIFEQSKNLRLVLGEDEEIAMTSGNIVEVMEDET